MCGQCQLGSARRILILIIIRRFLKRSVLAEFISPVCPAISARIRGEDENYKCPRNVVNVTSHVLHQANIIRYGLSSLTNICETIQNTPTFSVRATRRFVLRENRPGQ